VKALDISCEERGALIVMGSVIFELVEGDWSVEEYSYYRNRIL
jgi:hypothetical protein